MFQLIVIKTSFFHKSLNAHHSTAKTFSRKRVSAYLRDMNFKREIHNFVILNKILFQRSSEIFGNILL